MNQPVSQVRRPTNAFMIFSKEMTQKIKQKQPNIKQAELMKQVGQHWNVLPEDHKDVYKRQGAEDQERFKREIAEETKANGGKPLLTAAQRKEQVQQL